MDSNFEEIHSENRKLLEKYLNESVTHLGTVVTNNQDAIFALDLYGNFVQVNPALEKLLGYSINELNQMKLLSIVPIEDLDKMFHYFHKSILGEIQNYDSKMINSNKQILHLNVTNIPISVNNQIVGIYAVAKDITPFKRKKEEVRKIEAFHRVLTENVLDIMIQTNLQGEVLYISPACEHILGYSPNELINKNPLFFIHNDDKEMTLKIRKDVITKQQNGRLRYRFCKKDGNYVWVESLCNPIIDPLTNRVVEVISVVRDITERMKAEEELETRSKAFLDLIEHSPDAVLIVKEQKIKFINETGVKLFGALKKEDMINTSVFEIIHFNYHTLAQNQMKMIDNGKTTDFIEYKIVRLDGTLFDAEVKGTLTNFENQYVQHIIIRDITKRKKTEEVLINSEKLAIAGKMAAGIAHEVRNPLTSIKGFIQLMKEQKEKNTYLEIIQSEIDRIEFILSELLLLAKPHALEFEEVELITLTKDVKTLINTQAILKNIRINIVNDCENLTIRCNKNRLKQVFINFLKNSIEAIDDGGYITIEINKLSSNKVRVLFKDTGIGIPQHLLKCIGEPFFTTKENGTGLGIMISKQIIENHKGSVHIKSDENGTIIEVILPLT